MSVIIGKNYKIGVAMESSRGTAANPAVWMPLTDFSVENRVELTKDEASYGVIAEVSDFTIGKQFAEGELKGYVSPKNIGYFLKAALGSVSAALKGGESVVYNNTFSLLNSSQHPSMTLEIKQDIEQLKYALAVLKDLKLSFEVGKYAEFSAGFLAKKGASANNTPSYSDDKPFHAKHLTFKHATNLAGLSGASAVKIKSAEISIEKNAEILHVLGSVDPDDIINKMVQVEINISAYFTDATLKAIFEGGTEKAIEIDIVDTSRTIGTGSNPELKFQWPKVAFEDWSRGGGIGDIVEQSIKMTGFYSLSEAKLIEAVLTNEQNGY